MILNDRDIRKLCLVPTHQVFSYHNNTRHLYAHIDDYLYSVDTGHRYQYEDQALPLEKLTPEQQRGFVSGGGIVPGGNEDWGRMIYPFEPKQVKTRTVFSRQALIDKLQGHATSESIESTEQKIISYGTSSMGYDVRLGRKFKIFTNVFSEIIDPLNMPDRAYVDHEGDFVIIPPNSYVLGHTIEYFRMPEDVVAICVGKSTYARAGCAINVTPIEPGFEGQVVIEIANQTPLPMKVYADMGIAQFMFLRGDLCEISYAKRAGKYQGQLGITTARV
jgi:dCTP deaminase